MTKPLIVSIPHRLGRDEAVRRLKAGLGQVRTKFGAHLHILEETWSDAHLNFRVSALSQVADGSLDVADDHVRMEVRLPWLLAKVVEKIQPLIQKQGQLMLEKK
jgi:hypothetical protein